jgi:hypothetical protein
MCAHMSRDCRCMWRCARASSRAAAAAASSSSVGGGGAGADEGLDGFFLDFEALGDWLGAFALLLLQLLGTLPATQPPPPPPPAGIFVARLAAPDGKGFALITYMLQPTTLFQKDASLRRYGCNLQAHPQPLKPLSSQARRVSLQCHSHTSLQWT